MSYDIALNVGVGDIIVCRAMLMSLSVKINVMLNYGLLGIRGGESYRGFIVDFTKKVLEGDDRFSFDPLRTAGYPGKCWNELWAEGMRPQYMDLSGQLCSGKSLDCGPYICLHTKIRGFQYAGIKDQFLSTLRLVATRYKLVLIGEREVEMNEEYKIAGGTYSIYDSLKSLDGAIDLTIPKLGITPPMISQVLQDCKYMNEAVANVVIGFGGSLSLGCCTASKIINISNAPYVFAPICGPRGTCVDNTPAFIEGISKA